MPALATKKQHTSLKNLKWFKVIEEFITNGHNPVQAYELVYKDSNTAPQCASRLFKNAKFSKALQIRIDEIKAGTQRKVGEIDAMQQKAYNLAMSQKQPAAAVSAGTAIARLYGMDKDNSLSDAVQIVIMPPAEPTTKSIQSTVTTQLNESEVSE